MLPPIAPMLAKAVPEPPPGQSYEPKWDGFRAIVFRDGDEVRIDSRNGREITRFFPEVVAAVGANLPQRCVLDGEIVLLNPAGAVDFGALQLRLHPARSRIELLAAQTPAILVVFDVLAVGADALLDRPFVERRARLVELLVDVDPLGDLRLTPATEDLALARRWFIELEGAGLDGIMAKALDLPYQPGKRVMSKIKHRRTADFVVAGYREHSSGPQAVGSLLLGLYAEDGRLVPVGVVGSLTMAHRRELVNELAPLVTSLSDHPWNWAESADAPLEPRSGKAEFTSRWNPGKSLAFVPLRPERVLQVRYEALQGTRLRHLGQFDRWRPDRDPASCGFDQFEGPESVDLTGLWTR